MSGSASNRIPANRVAAIFLGLLVVWLAFMYWPRRKEPLPQMAPVKAESKLQAVGLADNPDWAGLPEFFAVWVAKVEWNGDKAYFAYWHPGSRSYAYFFEVVRKDGGYRFREISPQWLSVEGYNAEDGDAPIHLARRDAETPTHPFVFLSRLKTVPPRPSVTMGAHPEPPARPRVAVDLKPAPLVLPAPAPTSPP